MSIINFMFLFCILQNELVQPIITPRFALNCDMKLMMLLGELAAKYNTHIQVRQSLLYVP
jgi:guanine deaminase